MRKRGNKPLVLRALLTAIAAGALWAAAPAWQARTDQEAAVWLLDGPGPTVGSFAQDFITTFERRHAASGLKVRLLPVPPPADDDALIARLQEAAREPPALIVTRNGHQTGLVRQYAPHVNLVFSSHTDPRDYGIPLRASAGVSGPRIPATGIWVHDETDLKRLELLLDAYPALQHVGLAVDLHWINSNAPSLQLLRAHAAQRGVQLLVLRVDSALQVIQAVDTGVAREVQAWCLPRSALSVTGELSRHLAAQGRVVMAAHTPDAFGSAHLSYAFDRSFMMPTLVDLTVRVLRGEPPDSIPVQGLHRYQLAVRVSADPRLPPLNPAVVRRADIVVRP